MKTILLTGKTGQVGRELQRTLAPFANVIALDRTQLDLARPDSIRRVIHDVAPDIIVNAAAYTAVDKAESESALAMQVNAVGPSVMAEEARRINALLVHYSTDYVFDGRTSRPYVEEDEPNPLNVYGKSKFEGERAIAASGCLHLILRASWIYSNHGRNFVLTILRLAREREEVTIVDDQIGSPTWARLLAQSTADLIVKARYPAEVSGMYHLSASGCTSRYSFAKRILEIAQQISGKKTGWAAIRPTTTAEYPLPAARPLRVDTSKQKVTRVFGMVMSNWETQLRAFLAALDTEAPGIGQGCPSSTLGTRPN